MKLGLWICHGHYLKYIYSYISIILTFTFSYLHEPDGVCWCGFSIDVCLYCLQPSTLSKQRLYFSIICIHRLLETNNNACMTATIIYNCHAILKQDTNKQTNTHTHLCTTTGFFQFLPAKNPLIRIWSTQGYSRRHLFIQCIPQWDRIETTWLVYFTKSNYTSNGQNKFPFVPGLNLYSCTTQHSRLT